MSWWILTTCADDVGGDWVRSGILNAKNWAEADGFACGRTPGDAAWGGGETGSGAGAGVAREDASRAPGGEDGFCEAGAVLVSSYSCKRDTKVALFPFLLFGPLAVMLMVDMSKTYVDRPRILASLRRSTTVSFSHVRESKTVETNDLCGATEASRLRCWACKRERNIGGTLTGDALMRLPRGLSREETSSASLS